MSNTICVKINNRTDYLVFKFDENKKLVVFYKNNWIEVEKTGKLNQYKDRIFTFKG